LKSADLPIELGRTPGAEGRDGRRPLAGRVLPNQHFVVAADHGGGEDGTRPEHEGDDATGERP
jgi:hypothetical protein